jgi:hydrogenase-4 component F
MITVGGLSSSNFVPVAVFLILLVIIFAAFMYHVGRMVLGQPGEGMPKGEAGKANLAIMVALLVGVLLLGLYIPGFLNDAIGQIIQLFGGSA